MKCKFAEKNTYVNLLQENKAHFLELFVIVLSKDNIIYLILCQAILIVVQESDSGAIYEAWL